MQNLHIVVAIIYFDDIYTHLFPFACFIVWYLSSWLSLYSLISVVAVYGMCLWLCLYLSCLGFARILRSVGWYLSSDLGIFPTHYFFRYFFCLLLYSFLWVYLYIIVFYIVPHTSLYCMFFLFPSSSYFTLNNCNWSAFKFIDYLYVKPL